MINRDLTFTPHTSQAIDLRYRRSMFWRRVFGTILVLNLLIIWSAAHG